MTGRYKVWLLASVGIALAALILLAGGLSDLQLLPGHPPPQAVPAEEPSDSDLDLPDFRQLDVLFVWIAIILVLLLLVVGVYMIVSPEARKRILAILGLFLLFFAFLLLKERPDAPQPTPTVEASPSPQVTQPAGTPGAEGSEGATFEFDYTPPPWLTILTAISLALVTAAVVVGIGWALWRLGRADSPLEQIAAEAQRALDTLHAGADVRDTILRCYFEMSRVLLEHRGLERAEAMTPREFERQLKAAGLPATSVEGLTRLFESVRYGAQVAGEQEEQQAILCLEAVVQACRSPA